MFCVFKEKNSQIIVVTNKNDFLVHTIKFWDRTNLNTDTPYFENIEHLINFLKNKKNYVWVTYPYIEYELSCNTFELLFKFKCISEIETVKTQYPEIFI